MSLVALMIPTIDRIGGAERQVLALAKGLRRRGWNVTVLALAGTGGETAATLEHDGIGFLSLEMRKGLADPRGWLRLHAWLRRHNPDILHAHLPHAAWMARVSGRLAGTPIVVDTNSQCVNRRLAAQIWLQAHQFPARLRNCGQSRCSRSASMRRNGRLAAPDGDTQRRRRASMAAERGKPRSSATRPRTRQRICLAGRGQA